VLPLLGPEANRLPLGTSIGALLSQFPARIPSGNSLDTGIARFPPGDCHWRTDGPNAPQLARIWDVFPSAPAGHLLWHMFPNYFLLFLNSTAAAVTSNPILGVYKPALWKLEQVLRLCVPNPNQVVPALIDRTGSGG